jgi:hypothetical protein
MLVCRAMHAICVGSDGGSKAEERMAAMRWHTAESARREGEVLPLSSRRRHAPACDGAAL